MDEEKKEEEGENYKKEESAEYGEKPKEYSDKPSVEPSHESANVPSKPRENLTDKLRRNPFIASTLVCGVLAVLLLVVMVSGGGITGRAVSGDVAGENLIEYLNNVADSDVILIDIEDTGDFYLATIEFKGQEMPIYITKDGAYYTSTLIPLVNSEDGGAEPSSEPAEPILECVEPYGITSDTIIFYYSNSCGWCSEMKPGVEALEKEGYKFYWVEGSDAEASELIDNCIRSYMTSGGVPQFICPKTEEIHVGAFTDENKNLDQLALKEWVDNCISE